MHIEDGIKHKMLLLGFVNLNKYDSTMQECNCWDDLPCNAYFCNSSKWGLVSNELLQKEQSKWFGSLEEDKRIREMESFFPLDNPDLLREWRKSQ